MAVKVPGGPGAGPPVSPEGAGYPEGWLLRWARWTKLPPSQAKAAAYLVAAAAVGVALMGLPDVGAPTRPAPDTAQPSLAAGGALPANSGNLGASGAPDVAGYGQEIERELEAILGLMDGVGSVKVMVTWEQGPEQVLAYNQTMEERTTAAAQGSQDPVVDRREERQAVIVRDADGRRELPVLLTERHPGAKGVVVVADGARDSRVKLAIQRAVAAALGIAPYRIHVQAKRR